MSASYNLTSNVQWCVEFENFDLSITDVVDDLNAWECSSHMLEWHEFELELHICCVKWWIASMIMSTLDIMT